MRSRLPRHLAPTAVLALLTVAGCGLPGIGPAAPATTAAAPATTAAAPSPATSAPADPPPAKSASPEPTSSPAADDRVTVTGQGDTFRLVLPPKWKVAPRAGGLDQVTVSRGGILKPNAARAARNSVSYGAGAHVVAVRPAKNGGEPNVNIGNRAAAGVTDVADLAGPGKQALEGLGATKVRSRTTTVGGDPALQLTSRLQQGEFSLAFTQFLVLADDLVWITTVTELDDERSVAPQISDGLDFSI